VLRTIVIFNRNTSITDDKYLSLKLGNLCEKDHLGNPGVDGWIILRWIFRKWVVGVWTGSNWFRIETGGEHL
jgi:hypothetical protein